MQTIGRCIKCAVITILANDNVNAIAINNMVESCCIGADLVGRPVVHHVGPRAGHEIDLKNSGHQNDEDEVSHSCFFADST